MVSPAGSFLFLPVPKLFYEGKVGQFPIPIFLHVNFRYYKGVGPQIRLFIFNKKFVFLFQPELCKLVPKNQGMATSDLKRRVLDYVQEADEPLLQLMEALAEDYLKKDPKSELTQAQWQEVEARWKRHKAGESRSYTWEEVQENIEKARRNGF